MLRLRTLNRIALGTSALVLFVAFWNRNDLPAPSSLLPQLKPEPRQLATAKPPLSVEYAGVRYSVEPQYEYELYGMVVSYRQHDGQSRMHRAANDHLNVADLCVVWGDTASSPYLDKIRFWNGIFTCNFQTRDANAWASIKPAQISNNHLISADDFVRERITDVEIGDQIRLHGWLSSYGTGGAKRGTSITRTDTGDGACETIYLDDFEILEPTRNPWRTALWASLTVLLLSVVVHFRLPYRPYADRAG